MINVAHAIMTLFPTAVEVIDFVVVQDGQEQRISMWNSAKLGAPPTRGQLEAVTQAQFDDMRLQKQRSDARSALADITPNGKLLRAVALSLLDRINTIGAAMTPPVPSMTKAQFITAVNNKLANGAAD